MELRLKMSFSLVLFVRLLLVVHVSKSETNENDQYLTKRLVEQLARITSKIFGEARRGKGGEWLSTA